MTHFEIRKIFLDFFKGQEHKILPSSSLIPYKDPSLLFVNAGMNQFKSVILGLEKPPAKNAVTIQKCLRAGGKHNDLENVGQTSYHHTFFEMMGNFSFGGYFKKQAIALAWEFLTQKLKLSLEDLWISIYEKDEESYEIWRNEQKIPENKIYWMGKEDNFWQMGDTGPCGPCTEIHYYRGREKRPDPDQFIEIWNLVFMEFDDKGGGKRERLSVPCVDTGMGLERLCAILQNKQSNYHTDFFTDIIHSLEEASGCKYDFTEADQSEKQMAFRVLADHSRAAAFLMSDGVLPGNEGRNYVLRRILRRAFYYSRKLNPRINLLQKGAEALISLMNNVYPDLEQKAESIKSLIEAEDKQFSESLNFAIKTFSKKEKWTDLHELKALHLYKKIRKGGEKVQLFKELSKDSDFIQAKIPESSIKMKVSNFDFLDTKKTGLKNASKKSKDIFNKYGSSSMEQLQAVIEKSQDKKYLDSSLVWYLYNTHGLPFDLTRLIAEEQGYQVNLKEVEKVKEEQISAFEKKITNPEQQNLLQSLSEFAGKLLGVRQETEFTGYENKKEESKILLTPSIMSSPVEADPGSGLSMETEISIAPLTEGQTGWLITDKTCFYPEGGGPIGDRGELKTETGRAEVLDCRKKGDFIFHKVQVIEGELKKGQLCEMKVYEDHRRLIAAGHSATHLLHQALREELGSSVRQAGSLILPGELRFDFTYPKPLTEEQIKEIEKRVRKNIQSENPVSDADCSYEEAVQTGALFLKEEKYSSRVRVITMGDSREFCGGIHVKNTADIGSFKIISETGVQSGVRRITAFVNERADKWLDFFIRQNFDLRKNLQQEISVRSQNGEASLRGRDGAQALSGDVQPAHITKTLSPKGNTSMNVRIDIGREKINPFIFWIKTQDEKIKQLKNQLKNLIPLGKNMGKENQSKTFQSISSVFYRNPSAKLPTASPGDHPHIEGIFQLFLEGGELSIGYEEWIKKYAQSRDFLAEQILEFRKYLKLPVLKDIESSFQDAEKVKEILKDKIQEVQSLEDQQARFPWEKLAEERLKKQVKSFHFGEVKGGLLVMVLPITDRKVLSDMADQLKLKISSGVVVLLGEGQESWPLMVTVTKDLQKYISAGDLMKNTITPLLGGKGGGQARFAQGVITHKKHFPKLENTLLQVLNPALDEKGQVRERGKFLMDTFIFPFRTLWFKNSVMKRSLVGTSFSLAVLAGIYIFMLTDRHTTDKQILSSAKVAQMVNRRAEGRSAEGQRREPTGKGLMAPIQQVLQEALPVEQIKALTVEQVQMLTVRQLQALTAKQISVLTVKQLQALTVEQIKALIPEQLQALTPKQLQSFTLEQAEALTSEQFQFLTSEQIHILNLKRKKIISPK